MKKIQTITGMIYVSLLFTLLMIGARIIYSGETYGMFLVTIKSFKQAITTKE